MNVGFLESIGFLGVVDIGGIGSYLRFFFRDFIRCLLERLGGDWDKGENIFNGVGLGRGLKVYSGFFYVGNRSFTLFREG